MVDSESRGITLHIRRKAIKRMVGFQEEFRAEVDSLCELLEVSMPSGEDGNYDVGEMGLQTRFGQNACHMVGTRGKKLNLIGSHRSPPSSKTK